MQDRINSQLGSYQYGTNAAGEALVWAGSMLMVIEGTPYMNTPMGQIEVQRRQAVQLLQMMEPSLVQVIEDLRRRSVAEAKAANGKLLVRCP